MNFFHPFQKNLSIHLRSEWKFQALLQRIFGFLATDIKNSQNASRSVFPWILHNHMHIFSLFHNFRQTCMRNSFVFWLFEGKFNKQLRTAPTERARFHSVSFLCGLHLYHWNWVLLSTIYKQAFSILYKHITI